MIWKVLFYVDFFLFTLESCFINAVFISTILDQICPPKSNEIATSSISHMSSVGMNTRYFLSSLKIKLYSKQTNLLFIPHLLLIPKYESQPSSDFFTSTRIEIPEKISDHLPFKGYTSWQHLLYQECLTNLCRISYKTVRSLGKKHGLISSVILIHLTSSPISRSAQVYGWNR